MTIMLDLAPDVEARLREKAAQEGRQAEAVAESLLRQGLHLSPEETTQASSEPETLADLFAGRIGRIQGSSEPLSENCGERFTEYLVEKQRQGRL